MSATHSRFRIEQLQRKELNELLQQVHKTKLGQQQASSDYQYLTKQNSYETLCGDWPIATYEDYKPWIQNIKDGVPDLIWPGRTNLFAVSSGTTGEGKHLPIFNGRLKSDYRYLRKVIRKAIGMIGIKPFLFGHRLSLPGSIEFRDELIIGEISGLLAYFSPTVARFRQSCSPRDLARLGWADKYRRLVEAGRSTPVQVLNGVPTWIPQLLDDIHRDQPLESRWPDFTLCITGGASFANYEHLLRNRLPKNTHFLECYGASEGYYAIQHGEAPGDMDLLYSNNLFFELIPFGQTHDESFDVLPFWEFEADESYELVVSNNSGLFRYRTGDVIEVNAHGLIRVTDRVQNVLDMAGERILYSEIETILSAMTNYSHLIITTQVGQDNSSLAVITDAENLPANATSTLDEELQQLNRHYQIRRATGAFDLPVIYACQEREIIDAVLTSNKRAQSKIPKVINHADRSATLLGLLSTR